MASGKKGLGGGLSNLFGDTTVVDLKTETSADSVSKIAVSRIEPNPGQPRKVFAQEALDEGLSKRQGHSPEVEADDAVWLTIDKAQYGLGGIDSWGQITEPEYRLPYGDYEFRFLIRPVR